MNLDNFPDSNLSLAEFSEWSPASAFRHASPGWFSAKTWSFQPCALPFIQQAEMLQSADKIFSCSIPVDE
ncbi:MAG: hypothetical protein A2Z99_15160 [Treponema sp. GWB1_62_6]|nr:MAG: hypothetical protein A2Z99_15160 [Treponema sp. GWB1_62_6]OHE68633.1 MAG: hypothetical protein A2001_05880 [Treponema sp. GWC1_61_84]HCM26584.1 hypothetical protein [Treponema sp.]